MISGGSLPASPKNQTQWRREEIAPGISKKPGIVAASRDRFRLPASRDLPTSCRQKKTGVALASRPRLTFLTVSSDGQASVLLGRSSRCLRGSRCLRSAIRCITVRSRSAVTAAVRSAIAATVRSAITIAIIAIVIALVIAITTAITTTMTTTSTTGVAAHVEAEITVAEEIAHAIAPAITPTVVTIVVAIVVVTERSPVAPCRSSS